MDDCNPPLLSAAATEACFRFPVPRAIVQLLQHCSGPDASVEHGPDSRLHNATGLLVSSALSRPANCPAELLLIGETGMDGVVCGCVMHDPKLAGEMPLALFDPSTGRGDYLGLDTRRSIGVLIGMQLAQLTGAQLDDARAIAEEMGFDPDELPAEQPLDVRPRVPPGWRFAMTADGLGVVARAEHFSPEQEYDQEPDAFDAPDLAEARRRVEEALAGGWAASALWHLRNATVFVESPVEAAVLRRLAEPTYAALGRDQLGAVLFTGRCC